MTAAVRAENAAKIYGVGETEVRALDGVSIDFAKGAYTAIMGPSGSGKSTLLHCIAGLDPLTAGNVYLGGENISSMSDKQLTKLRRDRIGFVFQAFNLIPTLSARENILLPFTLGARKHDEAWLQQVVTRFGLQDRLGHRPSELSGGQQQRVAVARAVASKPEVVFADEPTGNLDSRSGSEILNMLRDVVDTYGQTVVMVTHDAAAAAQADRVVFLADGKIVDDLSEPTTEGILDRVKKLGGDH